MSEHVNVDDYLSLEWRQAAAQTILDNGASREVIETTLRLAAIETTRNFLLIRGYAERVDGDHYWLRVTKKGMADFFK